jgi:hypothetical protein
MGDLGFWLLMALLYLIGVAAISITAGLLVHLGWSLL